LGRGIVVLLAGALHAASTGWPVAIGLARGQTLWPLQLVAMGLLSLALLRTRSARDAFAVGWAFGMSFLACTFWWLFVAMHTYGGLQAPLAVLAVLQVAVLQVLVVLAELLLHVQEQ
jgi:apolipoprotein N-acyltransferase